MVLKDEQIKEFQDKGFIVLKGFFDTAVMDKVSAFLDDLRDKSSAESPSPDVEAKYFEKSPTTGEKILVRVENMFGDNNPELTRLLISPEATDCLEDLFGEPPLLFKDKANYKLPGYRPDKLHQDQAAGWNTYCDFFITLGIVVDANRKANGAISFLKSGNYDKELMGEEWQPLSEDDPPYSPRDEYMLLEADPGDVIFSTPMSRTARRPTTAIPGGAIFISPSTGSLMAICGPAITRTNGGIMPLIRPKTRERMIASASDAVFP